MLDGAEQSKNYHLQKKGFHPRAKPGKMEALMCKEHHEVTLF